LPTAQQESLKDMERKLVALMSNALLAAVPSIAAKRHLLKPLTMSAFGMLNWHYLWFRAGKGLTRDAYARRVTGLILAGADAALAAADEPAAAKKRTALAGRFD